jgi:membrane-associated phospholipid phosphatase
LENAAVDTVIKYVAEYLLFVMAAGFVVYWLAGENLAGKARLGVAAVAGLILTLVFIVVAGKLHSDPRPFVQNPALHPLFPHARDNGFPSDHSAAAGLIAALVLWRNRAWGAVFAVAAACVAAARVASHVHHVQDVVAGLALGVLAAAIGIWLAAIVMAWLRGRRLPVVGVLEPAAQDAQAPARHAAARESRHV